MVSRVSTGYQNDMSLRQLQKTQVEIEKTTYQITTGYKGNDLLSYSSDLNSLLNIYDLQNNTQMYLNNITTAQGRLESTESALNSLTDLLSSAANLWTIASNENSSDVQATLAPQAESLTETFYNVFNTKFDGRYIFSGQNGAETPTNDIPTATAFPGSPVPTTYYKGDSDVPSIISGPGLTSAYGISGDETGIAQVKAGLEALWYGLENGSKSDIDDAISVLTDAQNEISSLLGEVGGQMDSLFQLATRHESQATFLQQKADELDKVDVTEAMTEFTQQQAVLEASMAIITKINRVSLLDYL